MTIGTENTTADEITFKKFEKISHQIKNGTYKQGTIRTVLIPKPGKKKKRPLGILNFKDRIVQEAIMLNLNAIYEPIFQAIKLNFEFRPKRCTSDAIKKKSQQNPKE